MSRMLGTIKARIGLRSRYGWDSDPSLPVASFCFSRSQPRADDSPGTTTGQDRRGWGGLSRGRLTEAGDLGGKPEVDRIFIPS